MLALVLITYDISPQVRPSAHAEQPEKRASAPQRCRGFRTRAKPHYHQTVAASDVDAIARRICSKLRQAVRSRSQTRDGRPDTRATEARRRRGFHKIAPDVKD